MLSFPGSDEAYRSGHWVWTQDGPLAHTSQVTQAYLLHKLGYNRFRSQTLWPLNSLNLNPLDYNVWSKVQSKACARYHNNVGQFEGLCGAGVGQHIQSYSEEGLKQVLSKAGGRH